MRSRSSWRCFPWFSPTRTSESDIVFYTNKSHKTTAYYCLSGFSLSALRAFAVPPVLVAGKNVIIHQKVEEGERHV
ncbi:hypothetical protein D5072_15715 [Dickeya dianthicola]|uniref:Uncharacterized protein n=1 Tax=Dickeya dianthicola TaxID=204039 RepID=A0AAX1CC18_9GAMM|nr:hypothetical protein DF213_00465 [Dickeya dianthicola]RJL65992.1 hypothetical protein D5072_15715 [Dickeya dianthicola]RJL76511.1 hypothetical protein D5077_00455 [Dickeya dianthicola]